MLTRRSWLKLSSVSALGSFVPVPLSWPAAKDGKRRALVVAINMYVPSAHSTTEGTPASGAGATASANPRKREFGNLDGAVNDATLFRQILKDRFSFLDTDIVFLQNQEATRDRILREFREHLVNAASAGDISLFYYAGHGSQVRNLGSDEADQMDETLVPADAYHGVPDIRDKEMARLHRAALLKGVALTVILDSCHSGGMSRGGWNGIGKIRLASPDTHTVNDPPDRDPTTGKVLPDAATMGMLFLAAARKDQPAGETAITERDAHDVETRVAHGAFTAALARVLASPIADQSVEQICLRTQAILAGEGRVQVPICGGADRERRGLLGQPAGLGSVITLAVNGVTSKGTVTLRGGSALGLASGCVLVRTTGRPIRLSLTRVELATSEGTPLDGSAANAVEPGDLFKLQTWVTPPDTALKVYLPKQVPAAAEVRSVSQAIVEAARQNHFEALTEPSSENPPTHVLYWRDGSYFIERFPATARAIALGAAPSAVDLAKAVDGIANGRLWPILPPDRDMLSAIHVGPGSPNPAVQVVDRPEHSVYFLAGWPAQDSVEYAWFFKDAVIVDPNQACLPLRTDWKSSGDQLTETALRLARIYAWVNLDGPAGGGNSFPYRLAFERVGSPGASAHGPFHFKEQYKLVFVADPQALKKTYGDQAASKRYVYVFLIDSSGEAQCLFPDPANGNDSNRLPRTEAYPGNHDYDLEISEPAGTDNYFLVASEQPLDPAVFQWSGVRKREESRGSQRGLDFLFSSIGDGTRGVHAAHDVPVTWSIESVAIRSMP